jgi:TIR domain
VVDIVETVKGAVSTVTAPAAPTPPPAAEAYRDLTLPVEVWPVVAPRLADLGFSVMAETLQASASKLKSRVTVATRGEEKLYLIHVPAELMDVAERDNYAYFGSLPYLMRGREVRLLSRPLRLEEVDDPYRELMTFWRDWNFHIEFVPWDALERAAAPGASADAFASVLNVGMPGPPAPGGAVEQPGEKQRVKMFVSYSHGDQKWLERLVINLKPLERAKAIDVWSDQRLEPGRIWKDEIQRALDSARIAVLLVTPNFMGSDFIAEHELPTLLAAASKGGCLILVIHVSTAFLDNVPLGEFQAIPPPTRPLDTMRTPNQNKWLTKIVRAINSTVSTQ